MRQFVARFFIFQGNLSEHAVKESGNVTLCLFLNLYMC
jgi:hypothetical protein